MPVGPTLRRAVNAMRADSDLDGYAAIFQAATGMPLDFFLENGAVMGPVGVTLKQHNDFRYACITLQNYLKDAYDDFDGIAIWYSTVSTEQAIKVMLDCALKDETG